MVRPSTPEEFFSSEASAQVAQEAAMAPRRPREATTVRNSARRGGPEWVGAVERARGRLVGKMGGVWLLSCCF